jgi:hypothetical protein
VVTRLYNNIVAVFSVLRGPCRVSIREANSEARRVQRVQGVQQRIQESGLSQLLVGDSHRKLVVVGL